MNEEESARQHLALSAMGAVAVLTICWLGTSSRSSVQFTDKLIVGGVLIAIFAFGASLALRPKWTRRMTGDVAHGAGEKQAPLSGRRRVGHHPDCIRFEGHTVKLSGKIFCAGCTGLAAGSVLSILAAVLYMILPLQLVPLFSIFIVCFGMSFVGSHFIYVGMFNATKDSRLFVNAVLPFGFLLVTVGLLEATGNVGYSLIGMVISVLWLDTRIQMSIRRHESICRDCGEVCKSYGV